MGLFLGTHINKVDKKGRVSVPSQFRLALADQAFQGIILYPSLSHDGVAEGSGMSFLEELAAATSSQLDVFSDEQDDLATVIYGSSVQLPWDGDGRVVLPESMISHIGIAEQVAFVGKAKRFQLWLPEAHARNEAEAKARLRQNKPKLTLQKPEGT
jgi:MraZ protein